MAIVPSLTFGLHKIYDFWVPQNEFVSIVARKFGFFPMFFTGLFHIPFAQPKPAPLVTVVGSPIKFQQSDDPSIEDIQRDQEVFLKAIRELYDNNKSANGMDHITLKIV